MTRTILAPLKALTDLMALSREQGHVIRLLDPDGDYTEVWCNDGEHGNESDPGYVPDGRYKRAEELLGSVTGNDEPIKVRALVLAQAAYAAISTPLRSTDVRLEPGRGVVQSLRESAQEIRDDVQRRLARADLMERAAAVLEEGK